MIIKKQFELILDSGGSKVYNILPVRSTSMVGVQIEKTDFNYLMGLVDTYVRIRKTPTADVIRKNISKCIVAHIPDYPLPGAVTVDGKPVVNLSFLTDKFISDYNNADIYSMFLYSISLSIFMIHKPFQHSTEEMISAFLFSNFMILFGKSSGLVSSYKDLIPSLRLLIALYVHAGLFGKEVDKNVINSFSSKFYMDPSRLNLDFDFSSTIEFLRSINKNRIIQISENKFSSEIIKKAGVSSLPLYEDISRFFATIIASDVAGSSVFSHFWSKRNLTFFQKLYDLSLNTVDRYK